MPYGKEAIMSAQKDVRNYLARQWKLDWCRSHPDQGMVLGKYGIERPDISKAPEPTDKDLEFTNEFITVQKGKCLITVRLSEFKKLKKSIQNKILKLGGI